VNVVTATLGTDNRSCVQPLSQFVAETAVRALVSEAHLSPKPGLVDPRGISAHDDMDVQLLVDSAHALGPTFKELAEMTAGRVPDVRLRAQVGEAGRHGENRMMAATGGVNTHRGALWALGLLVCGAANFADSDSIAEYAGRLARLSDLTQPVRIRESHGAVAGRRYRVSGARGEAESGFPQVRFALGKLRGAREGGMPAAGARLHVLIELIARVDDTCLLHRGGAAGLMAMQRGARRVLNQGGPGTPGGAAALARLDDQARRRRLSPGGSGDMLAAALFLDELTRPDSTASTTR
jgi:triphosphoribosyl-dephospho-CoA synthase